ncbi:AAA domain-containing protein [Fictibacillus sp. Mic-4]|uniref:AAA domain-containing protein n=1 Tax=Fictibacillus sp. Mic-4 TaxID=3132826 RepID=UPI003CE86201
MALSIEVLPEKEKAIRLFTYLREFKQLSMVSVKHWKNYENILWLHSITNENYSYTFIDQKNSVNNDTLVLQMRKPIAPKRPDLPEQLEDWIYWELTETETEPILLSKRLVSDAMENEAEAEKNYIYLLKNHAHVKKIWNDYIENDWSPWYEEYKEYLKAQKAYSQLFGVYQKVKKLGEEYETVLGLGLLNWEPVKKNIISRHLLTHPVTIELEPEDGEISVALNNVEESSFSLEQDMLDVHERPNQESLGDIHRMIRENGSTISDIEPLVLVLKSWIQTVSADGYYENAIELIDRQQPNPIVSFSPALILRKRSDRNFIKTYDTIIQQLKEDETTLPEGIHRIVEIMDDMGKGENALQAQSNPNFFEGKEYYMPLAANEEQMKIVDQIESRNGVIVQGPPGTGKSHTIANLMSHLLATGKKILVTSQTPRALKVLKNKLPEELQHLCVSLLGNDKDALRDMENVVQGIIGKQQFYSEDRTKREIKTTEDKIKDLRKKKAGLEKDLLHLIEKETYEHHLCGGTYIGTLQEIAKVINKESSEYQWMDVELNENANCPLSNDEALEFLKLRRLFHPLKERQVKQDIPAIDKLMDEEQFQKLVEEERILEQQLASLQLASADECFTYLSDKNGSIVQELHQQLDRLIKQKESLSTEGTWVQQAGEDIVNNQHHLWIQLYSDWQEKLATIEHYAKDIGDNEIELPAGKTRKNVLDDARKLYEYFKDKGWKTGIPGFRPQVVREHWYFLKEVKLNGSAPKSIDQLEILIQTLDFDFKVEKMCSSFQELTHQPILIKENRLFTLTELKVKFERMEAVYQFYSQLEKKNNLLQELNLPSTVLQRKDFSLLRDVCAAVLLNRRMLEVQKCLQAIDELIAKGMSLENKHPIYYALDRAYRNRDYQLYLSVIEELKNLEKLKVDYARLSYLEESLKKEISTIVEECKRNPYDDWDKRFASLNQAWKWAQAKTWLKEFLAKDVDQVKKDLAKTEDSIRKHLNQVIADKAWSYCFERLTEKERQHLLAWTTSMRKIGKGTGKNAERYRRDARSHMDECRTAIPAWIMPLYQVVDTIIPSQELFDVVIIDEASQSGPDALFLMYIAKKIIVVGDDKQISPEFVGLNRDDVFALNQQYIHDIPHRDNISVDSSFFDLANILFGGRIVLREHFRCMPEIIGFSNMISYPNTPLIPLRPFHSDRLEPIVPVYVKEGYREGSGQNVRNEPEADQIVSKIEECLKDPKYNGKSFGVISMQGKGQAALIEKKLLERIGIKEIEERKIICGDAYAFQGDERDVIFLSLVVAPGETRITALVKENDRRRFNVAMSRAKDQVFLFHSVSLDDLRNKECLRYQLLSYCYQPVQEMLEAGREKCESQFEFDVFDRISSRGYRIIPQYEVAGYRIDFVIEGENGRLAVECDGDKWHGLDRYEEDMKRQRTLERLGWVFWRVRGSEFYFNPDRAMLPLWEKLKEMKIKPLI